MSSHHFVREGQEPALFILDPVSLELIQPLLEWAPFVIVSDSSLDQALHWGIKIDAVLAKQDDTPITEQKVTDQGPVAIISYPAEEDPLLAGLTFLTQRDQHAVTIVSKPEEIFSIIEGIKPALNIVLLNKEMKWSYVAGGIYEKWLPLHTEITIKSQHDKEVSCKGLITKGPGVFDVVPEDIITVQSDFPFWIGESLI